MAWQTKDGGWGWASPGTKEAVKAVAPNYDGGTAKTTSPTSRPSPTAAAPALPSLSAEDLADLATRRRNATRSLELAETQGAAAEGRLNARHQLNLHLLRQRMAGERAGMMQELGSQGLARQPRFGLKGTRALETQEGQESAMLGVDATEQLSAIRDMVTQQRVATQNEYDQVEAERVRRAAILSNLIRAVGA